MKKWLLILTAVIMLFSAGCSFKVEKNTFYLPQDEVKGVEIQREYFGKEDTASYFRSKVLTEQKDLEKVCEMVRKLPVVRASSAEPNPITEFSMIIVITGERDHHLILTDEMAFYDQIAYEYSKPGVYEEFLKYYNNLGYAEEDAEPNRF